MAGSIGKLGDLFTGVIAKRCSEWSCSDRRCR